ncbi:MAG: SpaA isopeptide-forming pilin-related protein, partial [Bacteroidetes bacterium]|nr:SpaA isopeptide-forming pilin-related protein [Bacteroidota bacterium]
MKRIYVVSIVLFCISGNTNLFAQAASATWPLTSNQNPNTPTGNIQASQQSIGAGSASPYMQLYPQTPYNSDGQHLVTGYQGPGWPAGPVDYSRYIQFDVTPTSGNTFTAQYISFRYGDNPLPNNFNLLKAEVWYAIDNNWNSSVQLNSNPLDYLNTTMQTFSKSINVQVANGQTFSIRIFLYTPNGSRGMTPTLAIHKNVIIEGRTSPVVTTGSICGMKFNDLNGNGSKDEGEPGILGWTITLSSGAVPMTRTTGEDGTYCFNDLPAGTYTLSETQQDGWDQTYPTNPSTHTVILPAGQSVLNVDFGNKQLLGSICGMKFNDLNGNGANDNEPALSGWVIELTYNGSNGVVTLRDTTDSNGGYCFNNLSFGNYTITEVNKSPWTQTAPASGSYTVTINQEVNLIGKDFGNKEVLNPDCTDFENNSMNGWQANNISTSFQQNGNNHYIQTTDQAGVSTFYTTSKPFTGNWTSLFANGCGSLCFDITFIYGGDVYNGVTPPQTLTPYIALEGAGFKASFIVNQSISVGDGWHTYCAPLSFLNSDGTLPSNSNGYWIMTLGTASDWNTLLTNVTKVRLLADPTSYQGEKIGYDNICLKNTGDCNSPLRLGSICGFKILDKDGDGERDANEDIIPNWGITLTIGNTTYTATTGADGQYCFENLPAGTYTVFEEHRTGFRQIFPPSPGVHTITLLPGENKTNINFSNVEDISV